MITPIVLKPANAGRTKVVIIYHGNILKMSDTFFMQA